MLIKMEVAAVALKDSEEVVVVGSMDVVGLYPNLDIRRSARSVREAAEKCGSKLGVRAEIRGNVLDTRHDR